jgi:hypothetical protein
LKNCGDVKCRGAGFKRHGKSGGQRTAEVARYILQQPIRGVFCNRTVHPVFGLAEGMGPIDEFFLGPAHGRMGERPKGRSGFAGSRHCAVAGLYIPAPGRQDRAVHSRLRRAVSSSTEQGGSSTWLRSACLRGHRRTARKWMPPFAGRQCSALNGPGRAKKRGNRPVIS